MPGAFPVPSNWGSVSGVGLTGRGKGPELTRILSECCLFPQCWTQSSRGRMMHFALSSVQYIGPRLGPLYLVQASLGPND